jgi:hypothetical protein
MLHYCQTVSDPQLKFSTNNFHLSFAPIPVLLFPYIAITPPPPTENTPLWKLKLSKLENFI